MKKLFGATLLGAGVLTLASCGEKDFTDCIDNCEIALITDKGTIDDKSFNQGAWEGVEAYANENEIYHKYYRPTVANPEAPTTAEYIAAIDLAVEGGAEVIVTPGYYFQEAVGVSADKYTDVTFIILDGFPDNGGDWSADHKANVYSIFYAEHQSGYLAGYAAVKEGYRELGFMGGDEVPAVKRFGYGYIQGIEDAAAEESLTLGTDITLDYMYLGTFAASDTIKNTALDWFNPATKGNEVIFACAGGAGNSVMSAAGERNTDVIGVDVDQYAESDTVVTSAMKQLASSVEGALTEHYNDTSTLYKKNQSIILDASNGGIGLAIDNSRFDTFTEEMYNTVFNKLKNNTITVDENLTMSDYSSWVSVLTPE